MKHLIETTDLSSLTRVDYDRIVLDSTANKIIVRGGGYEYVDLGLPSGLKWAKCNVGAESETDYGYYFQWGDIVDKSNADCSWASYKYYDDSNNTLTKYNTDSSYGTVDNKTTLEPEDDAARAHMGSDWRMPTIAEFGELIDNTTNEWVTDYNGTGVNGRKFTSKTNGNSIFFPAAGHCGNGSMYSVGTGGDVWSSSLDDSSNVDAWFLNFDSGYISNDGDDARCYGRSVRGVCK